MLITWPPISRNKWNLLLAITVYIVYYYYYCGYYIACLLSRIGMIYHEKEAFEETEKQLL